MDKRDLTRTNRLVFRKYKKATKAQKEQMLAILKNQIEDEDVKLELLRIQDKINKRGEINLILIIAVMTIFGVVLGFMAGYSYAIAEGIVEVLGSLN